MVIRYQVYWKVSKIGGQVYFCWYVGCYHALPVCKVGGHDEVVLHNEAGLFGVQDEPLDHLGSH